jgi:hypothetical protein
VLAEVLRPLEKKLRQLKKECRKLGESIAEDPALEDLLDEIGGIPEMETPLDTTDLTGSAASTPVPSGEQPSAWQRFGDWFGGFLTYVGVRG